EETAQPAEEGAQCNRRSEDVEVRPDRKSIEPPIGEERDRASDDRTIIDDSTTPVLERLEQIVDILAPVFDAVERASPDQPGDEDPESHVEDHVPVQPLSTRPPPGQPGCEDEGQDEHDAEAIDR